MEKNPTWEADSGYDSKEIPRPVRNPNIRVHKSLGVERAANNSR
jgi:hypothetical protein